MLLTIHNNLQAKSFVKSEKYHYNKFASASDAIQIHDLEKKFCKKNKIPAETIEGVKLFLDMGGKILVQSSYQEEVIGAFWIISIKDLLHNEKILKALFNNSPLKKLYLKGMLWRFDPESFLIYSWTYSVDGKWFYRLISKWITNFYKGKLLYGFVLKENATAVYYYLKMGCKIIDELSNLYSTSDAHYILMYQT